MKKTKSLLKKAGIVLFLIIQTMERITAQNAAGIDQATTEVKSYIDPISNLIIAIGAVVGLIGGIRVYIKWQSGDQDTQKSLMGWFGACLFLVLVGVVIKAFFT
jgi:phage-related minor tail protein